MTRKDKTLALWIVVFILAICFCGCAQTHYVGDCVKGEHIYGFWGGLWHGIICPISFVGSLFDKNITIFAVNNCGRWYTFGFCLGVGALSASATKSTSK